MSEALLIALKLSLGQYVCANAASPSFSHEPPDDLG